MEEKERLSWKLNRFSKDTTLLYRFDKSVDKVESKSPGWEIHTDQTKERMKELCSEYSPCSCQQGCVYCESGESPEPFHPYCYRCVAWTRTRDPEQEIKRSLTLRERYLAARDKQLKQVVVVESVVSGAHNSG